MSDASFPKSRRVLKSAEFERVFSRRRSQGDAWLLVYGYENGLAYPRLGLVASRKYGNAVRRARWKRRLREAFRLAQQDLPAGIDLVVLPRSKAEPSLALVQQSLLKLARRVATGMTD